MVKNPPAANLWRPDFLPRHRKREDFQSIYRSLNFTAMKMKLVSSAFSLFLLCTAMLFTACQTAGPDIANEEIVKGLLDKTLDLWNNGNMAVAENPAADSSE